MKGRRWRKEKDKWLNNGRLIKEGGKMARRKKMDERKKVEEGKR